MPPKQKAMERALLKEEENARKAAEEQERLDAASWSVGSDKRGAGKFY